jgi:hypothetical protein
MEDSAREGGHRTEIAHDPEKLVLDLIGDGNRFSDKIMRKKNVSQ